MAGRTEEEVRNAFSAPLFDLVSPLTPSSLASKVTAELLLRDPVDILALFESRSALLKAVSKATAALTSNALEPVAPAPSDVDSPEVATVASEPARPLGSPNDAALRAAAYHAASAQEEQLDEAASRFLAAPEVHTAHVAAAQSREASAEVLSPSTTPPSGTPQEISTPAAATAQECS